MENLFSVIDLSKAGLRLEKAKAEVYSSNIANVHNSQYFAKSINFAKLLGTLDQQHTEFSIDLNEISDEQASENINLDQEVAGLTESELRYQTIAQAIQRKFGLIDLVIGGKNK